MSQAPGGSRTGPAQATGLQSDNLSHRQAGPALLGRGQPPSDLPPPYQPPEECQLLVSIPLVGAEKQFKSASQDFGIGEGLTLQRVDRQAVGTATRGMAVLGCRQLSHSHA